MLGLYPRGARCRGVFLRNFDEVSVSSAYSWEAILTPLRYEQRTTHREEPTNYPTLRMKKEYAIVSPDGTYMLDFGYYGNSPAILLYSKKGGQKAIELFYRGAKLKKLKIADMNNNCLYD